MQWRSPEPRSRAYIPASLGIGLLAGVASGLLGVGGGVLLVPLLTFVLRFSQHNAHATSLAAIVPIAVVSGALYARAGEIDFGTAVFLALGAVVGAPIGAAVMSRTSEGLLKAVFGLVLLVASIELLWP